MYRATCHIRPVLPSFRQWAKVMEHTRSRGKGMVLGRRKGEKVDQKGGMATECEPRPINLPF